MGLFSEDIPRRVIEHPRAHFRVLGPPASGKTRLLVERFRALGARGESVFIVTYSAANHRRLADAVFERGSVRIGASPVLTWSRLAAEVVESAGRRPPLLVTDFEEHLLLQAVIAEHERRMESELRSICRSDRFRQELRDACHAVTQAGLDPAELRSKAKTAGLRDVLLLCEQFEIGLQSKGALTHYHMAREASALVERGLGAHAISGATVILVDDFQDVDPGQFALLTALSPPDGPAALEVFGDPLGSVFGSRGTQQDFLMSEFPRLYEGETFTLKARRPAGGVPAASLEALLREIVGEAAGDYLPCVEEETNARGFGIEIVRDEMDEVYAVADRISGLLGGNTAANDIAVLTNNKRAYAPLLAAAAAQRGVPLDTGRPESGVFAEYANAVLALVDAPDDTAAMRAVLTSPLYRYLREGVGQGRDNGDGRDGGEEHPRSRNAEEGLRARVRDTRRELESCDPPFWMERIVERFFDGPCEARARTAGDTAASRELSRLLESWAHYITAVGRWGGRPGLRAFVALDAAVSRRVPARSGTVALLSCREAKGRYFPHVFVLGCSELLFPSATGRESILPVEELDASVRREARGPAGIHEARTAAQRLAEEHHLLYIALTRARHGLRVTAPESFSGEDYPAPADFLRRTAAEWRETPDGTRSRIPPQIRFARVWAAAERPEPIPRLGELSPAAFGWHAPAPRRAPAALEPFPISQSALKAYTTCPRRFFYQKALRVSEEDSPPARIGRLAHVVLAELNRRFPARAKLVARATPEVVREVLDGALREAGELGARPYYAGLLRRQLETIVGDCLDLEREALDDYAVLSVEEAIHFTRGPWRFTGFLDRVQEVSSGEKVIVDYKTSARHDKQAKTIRKKVLRALEDPAGADWQIPLYIQGVKEVCGSWPRAFTLMIASAGLKAFSLTFRVCRDEAEIDPDSRAGKTHSYFFASEIESVMDEAGRVAREMFAPRPGFERTENRADCWNCSFKRLCRREDG